MVERDAVDLAQLLGEQVGAVEPLVELLDAGELELLALGQVARVLPQREPGALELLGELGLALAARLVPDLAADLVQRVGGQLDEVERVVADAGVGAALADRSGDPRGHVAGDELDLVAALFAEQIQELLDRLAVPAGAGPHQPAGVVVDDDGEVSLPLADRDLIDPDPLEPREQVAGLRSARRSHALQIQPTVRHAIRISCETAVFDACTVSHAT